MSNRIPSVRELTAGRKLPVAPAIAGLVALMTVSGCSWFHHRSDEPAVAARASAEVPDSADALPADEMTATEAATSGAGASASASSSPTTVDAGVLAPNAPKSYVVKRGDTLWGIASTFLRDPWLWPEVWYINPQVANPHLIYPGDTLALAFGKDGRPMIRLEQGGAARLDPRLRSSPLDGAVPTIPYSAISAFLSRPSVLTKEQAFDSPHVVAFRDEHVVAGTGHTVYIADLKSAQPNTRYSVVHVGDPLRDPDDNKVVGYQGIYTATALVSQPGDPTKALLIDTSRETMQGDKVLSADLEVPLNFMLRAPRNDVHGRIISVIDGTQDIGQYQIVVINRGKRHGIDAGHVLAVDTAGKTVHDVYGKQPGYARWLGGAGTSFSPKVKLPDERAGTVLIFKSYDRVSYGLIVGAADVIHVHDVVHNP